MAIDPYTLFYIALSVVGVAVVVLVLMVRRVRHRAAKLREEIAGTSARNENDRAYNKIRLALAEAAILRRQGIDVSRPSGQLDEAQGRMDRRDFEGAMALANSAHESLVSLQHGAGKALSQPQPALFATVPNRPAAVPSSAAVRSAPTTLPRVELAPPAEGPRLEKNRAESRFQLNLLVEDLAKTRGERPKDPRIPAGERGLNEAQLAYTKADYTEALRLALKARRALGSHVEGFPISGRGAQVERSWSEQSAEEVAPAASSGPGETCPRCGKPTRPGDQFCRSCGAPRGGSTCPRCRSPVSANDAFCASCGAPVA